jgi:predicted Rossmann fold flavoprotein
MEADRKRIAIIGAGAAGFFAAIRAKECAPNTEVTIFEATSRPLAKVRISGGGRCNVTHHCFNPKTLVESYPRGGRELRGPFSRFQPRDTLKWFADRGIECHVEADGRMFPTTNDSATIADCLLGEAQRLGVEVRLKTKVTQVKPGWRLELVDGSEENFDAVLVAAGGSALGRVLFEDLDHALIPPVPSLFTFVVEDPRIEELAGLSFQDAEVFLKVEGEKKPFYQRGPVLITHWGFSGPAVLKLSAWAARALHSTEYRAEIRLRVSPGLNPEQVREALERWKDEHPRAKPQSHPPLDLPRRYWERLIQVVWSEAPEQSAHLKAKDLRRMAEEISGARFEVNGKGQFKEEFVTAGGVPLKEVNFKTMESRKHPGLYFSGECLDIDGITGGFNFQNAWTTAWIAGEAMVAPASTDA